MEGDINRSQLLKFSYMSLSENPEAHKTGFHQYQKIENLDFQLTESEDVDSGEAVKVINFGNKLTAQELEQQAREQILGSCWWLREYWQAKGDPKEQFSVKIFGQTVELYNYCNELTSEQIGEMQRVFEKFSDGSVKEEMRNLRYILIENAEKLDPKTGEYFRGVALVREKAFVLYPRAVLGEKFRIAGVSGFAGTFVHEMGHILVSQDTKFMSDWKEEFDWKNLPDEEVEYLDGHMISQRNERPERLITGYANFSSEEDICDSLSGAINNPSELDKERLAFIEDRWLKHSEELGAREVQVTRKAGADIRLPILKQPIKYKVVPGREIKAGKIRSIGK